MKASIYIKSLGFTGGITRIAKLTGWDRRTLYRFYNEEPFRFEIIVLGCVSKESENQPRTITAQIENGWATKSEAECMGID